MQIRLRAVLFGVSVLAASSHAARPAQAATAAANPPVPIEEALAAPDGFIEHLRGLERTHTYAVIANGKPIAIEAIVDEYGILHKKDRAPDFTLSAPVPLASAAPAAALVQSVLPDPGEAGGCPAGTTLCATYRQPGDVSYVLPDPYPKRFAADPTKPAAFSVANIERAGADAFRKGADGNCIEDVLDGGTTYRAAVACPGTRISFGLPGCIVRCTPQLAFVTITDDFVFDSYTPTASCAAGKFIITPTPGRGIGKTHTLNFEIEHPSSTADNVQLTCAIAITVSGPAGESPIP